MKKVLLKKRVNPVAGIAMFIIQSTMYISVICYTIKIGDVVRTGFGVYKIGLGFWGWLYLVIGASALYFLVVNILQKKKELI